MAKKEASKGGLKLVAGGPGRRPMVWRVTAPGLSRTYSFTPGVTTYVKPEDTDWFADPDNTEGRVFEVVAPEAPAPDEVDTMNTTTKGTGKNDAGGDAGATAKKHDTSTPEGAFAAVGDVVDRFTEIAGRSKGATPPAK